MTTPLSPSQVLVNGRYRLLVCQGIDRAGRSSFWHAHDELLDRDVALTALPGDPLTPGDVADADLMRQRARLLQSLGSPVLPTLFDFIGPDDSDIEAAGLVSVAIGAWTAGAGLAEVVRSGPIPPGRACRMMRPLITVLDRAHQAGLTLGLGAADLLRVGDSDIAVLTFAQPLPVRSRTDEVREAAAALHLLLTGTWPAAEPATLPDTVPTEVVLAVRHGLRPADDGGSATCRPLRQAVDAAASTPEADIAPEALPPLLARHVVQQRRGPKTPARWSRAAVLGALLVILSVLTWTSIELVGVDQSAAPPAPVAPAAPAETLTSPPVSLTMPPPPPQPQPTAVVVPANLDEYVVTGTPDNLSELPNLLSDVPNRTWSTDQYLQQLPAFEPGVGIMAAFDPPIEPRSVDIDSPSAGTIVQIRTAQAQNAPLSATALLATATLGRGRTDIALPAGPPTRLVLVWITHLAGGNSAYRSTIDHISYLSIAADAPAGTG